MQPANATAHWYVLYTRFNYTRKIADTIRGLNLECFMPMRVVTRQWSDRVKKAEEPLFLNYLFVRTPLIKKNSFLEIDGVLRFVSNEGKPVAVPDQTISDLKLLVGSERPLEVESYLLPGDKVMVINGIFTGIEGVLLRKVKSNRLLIRIPLLKQAISVELSAQDLYKLCASETAPDKKAIRISTNG